MKKVIFVYDQEDFFEIFAKKFIENMNQCGIQTEFIFKKPFTIETKVDAIIIGNRYQGNGCLKVAEIMSSFPEMLSSLFIVSNEWLEPREKREYRKFGLKDENFCFRTQISKKLLELIEPTINTK